MEAIFFATCGGQLETRTLPIQTEVRLDSPATLPGESMEEAAPQLLQKNPTYTPAGLTKPKADTFPHVAAGVMWWVQSP